MDQPEMPKQLSARSRMQNTVRESDIHADPEYKEKKEFFDQLLVKVQINCNALQQNAMKEAKAIKDNLSVLISQLPARVQQMKISDFCKEFSFELVDGNLVMMDDSDAPGSSLQNQIYKTVQMTRTMNAAQVPQAPSGEVISQFQLLRGGAGDLYLRLTRNGASYDLTKQKMSTMSESEKSLIRSEITVFTKLLKDATPK
ncbi:hypothetical protein WA538_005822, partial [Blastocystis sp. DL]